MSNVPETAKWFYGVDVTQGTTGPYGRECRTIALCGLPPNEPHPDKLKRCEVCKHNGGGFDEDGDTILKCCKPGHEISKFPPERTCEHWQHDGHNTGDTDE